jgi:hypothetical protein
MIDNQTRISRVFVQIADLKQSLWGNGVSPVTAKAVVEGRSLAAELEALKVEIDKFLQKGYPK